MIRLNELSLHKFRCFDRCRVSLHPNLTVLVARNGQGKTAVMDAIALALGPFVDGITGLSRWPGFSHRDIRRVHDGERTLIPPGYAEFRAVADIEGANSPIEWRRWMRNDAKRAITSRKELVKLKAIGADLRDRLDARSTDREDNVVLPLIAYYGVGRRWSGANTEYTRSLTQPLNPRFRGYLDCLNGSASYGLLVSWYEETFLTLGRSTPAVGHVTPDRPERLLAAVNKVVTDILEPETGWRDPFWDSENDQLVLQHETQERLPIDFLSDGVRTTVALTADVAHRCARLNPRLGVDAARKTPGILLIDEIDLHLHPEWQQEIVPSLRHTFPELQLVLSTHSPQVLSSVDAASIRKIELTEGIAEVNAPSQQTQGTESGDVLAKVMDVDPRPDVPPVKWLSSFRALIQAGHDQSAEAERLRIQLNSHYGADHPLLLELVVLQRLQNFKREHKLSSK